MNPLAAFPLLPTGLLAAAACAAASSSFTMSLSPPGVVGTFVWTNACCRVSGEGLVFSFSCDGGCACGGCVATGFFSYEGYRLPARGGRCPCGGSVEPDHGIWDGDDGKPSPLPGASACFSKRVILFEDEYEDAPGLIVPWRSTETELDCRASGGPNGGRVRIEARGADGLVPYGGRPLPFECELRPFEEVSFRNAYRAVRPSGGEGGIVVRATFEENGTGEAWTTEDRATAVRVEVAPVVPREGFPNRHRMGVREGFRISTFPKDVTAEIRLQTNWTKTPDDAYLCPIRADEDGVEICVDGVSYKPGLQVVEPTGILCTSGFDRCQDGVIAMELEPYILPTDVSFFGVKVMEVPAAGNAPTGYFADPRFEPVWSHTEARGAGVWHRPGFDNFFFADEPSFGEYCPPPLAGGVIDWTIPLAWGEETAQEVADRVGTVGTVYHQVFTLDAAGGLRIDKFSQWIHCTAEGAVTHSPGIRRRE